MNSSINKLLRNVFANQLGFLVSVAVTFFLSPFVVNSLGGTRYGIWSLIVSLTGNYGLLAFGVQGALTRYMAHAAATDDRERVNGYFNTALSFLLGSATLTIVIGLVIVVFINTIFVVPIDMVEEARSACVLVTFSAAVTFTFAAFDSVLIAHQQFQFTNVVGIFTTLIRAGVTVWLLKRGYGIVALAALGTGLTLFNGLIVAVVSKRIYSWLRLSLSLARRSYFKDLADYGYKSFTIGVAVALVYQCDLLIIGIYLPPEEITTYSLAATLITYLIQFISAIAFTLGPYITELHAKKKYDDLRVFIIKGSCLLYMLGGLIVAGCLVFGEYFFTLWVGPKYSNSAIILSILVIPQFFATGARMGGSLLVGMAKIGPLAIAALSEGVSNIILSFILVRYLGIIGVAVGTFVPILVNNGLWLPLYISRIININPIIYFMRVILPGLGVGIITVTSGLFARELMQPNTWIFFIINIFIVTFCSITASFFIFKINFKKKWM